MKTIQTACLNKQRPSGRSVGEQTKQSKTPGRDVVS